MAEEAKPWEAAFRRVCVEYWPPFKYPLKPTAVDLDAAERELNFKFPLSYRAFAEEYGLDGELHTLPRVLSLTRPTYARKGDWFRSVVDATNFYRKYNWGEGIWAPDAALLTFLRRVVVFAMDPGYHDWVFDPHEITNTKLGECRIYDVNRETEVTAVASSFDEWLTWIDEHYRFEDEDAEEKETRESRVQAGYVYKPDSPLDDPMTYQRSRSAKRKQKPSKKSVRLWLAFNNNTARDLARSIRDERRADAFPILADALQDAGCAHADLLDACRTGDPDIDGKWVLQVLLGNP